MTDFSAETLPVMTAQEFSWGSLKDQVLPLFITRVIRNDLIFE